MPSYLSLINWTEQGVKAIKQSPERLDAVKQATQAAGGRMIFFYMTMGRYDLVTLYEVPNDDAAARVSLQLGMGGNVRTTTLRAFTEDEYRKLVGSV